MDFSRKQILMIFVMLSDNKKNFSSKLNCHEKSGVNLKGNSHFTFRFLKLGQNSKIHSYKMYKFKNWIILKS